MSGGDTDRPARNRVAPTGGIISAPGRGAWMGNRGRLHEGRGTRDVVRNHQVRAWLTCALEFKGRRRGQWDPRRYTLLFFLDEAVALAAGHRPCAACRRADYNAYRDAWARGSGGGRPSAGEMDERLHGERLAPRGGERVPAPMPWTELPDGVFVLTDNGPAVVVGDHLTVWNGQDNAYGERLPRPQAGTAAVLTPPASVAVIRAGYAVQIDPSAR